MFSYVTVAISITAPGTVAIYAGGGDTGGGGRGAQVCPTRKELTLAHNPSPLCNCPRQDSWVWQNMFLTSGPWEKHPDATAMTSCVVRDSLGTGHFL